MARYKSLPHQIRRVFERRNAQKPEFYGVRRFAKRNWNRRTQCYRHTLVRVWRVTMAHFVLPAAGYFPCIRLRFYVMIKRNWLSSYSRQYMRILSTDRTAFQRAGRSQHLQCGSFSSSV